MCLLSCHRELSAARDTARCFSASSTPSTACLPSSDSKCTGSPRESADFCCADSWRTAANLKVNNDKGGRMKSSVRGGKVHFNSKNNGQKQFQWIETTSSWSISIFIDAFSSYSFAASLRDISDKRPLLLASSMRKASNSWLWGTEIQRRVRNRSELDASPLTVAVGDIKLVTDRLETSATPALPVVYALPVINVPRHALATEVRAVNVIVVHQVVTAFAALQEVINVFTELIDIWERKTEKSDGSVRGSQQVGRLKLRKKKKGNIEDFAKMFFFFIIFSYFFSTRLLQR